MPSIGPRVQLPFSAAVLEQSRSVAQPLAYGQLLLS